MGDPARAMLDHALGALAGVAMGDAMGMPGQTLSRAEIAARHGRIEGFVAPFAGHPVSHGLRAGQVTDDTEQTLLLARLLSGPGGFDETAWAKALLEWESDVRRRGLRDLLGPSSKAALEALMRGVPADQTGRGGTTNGAAMRIAPVGIAVAGTGPALLDAIETTCRVTHATGEAMAAAAAVAAVISQGVAGRSFDASIPAALAAARLANTRGAQGGVGDMAARIAAALELAAQGDEALLAETVGTSVASHQSVAAAFGVVRLAGGDPWRAALIAANIGDDTDTIGAIACAMAGACAGIGAFPAGVLDTLEQVNGFDLRAVARDLLALRLARRPSQGAA